MPAALVEKINAEVRRGMQTPAAKAQMQAESMATIDLDPAGFTRYVASEIERWTPAVKSVEKAAKQESGWRCRIPVRHSQAPWRAVRACATIAERSPSPARRATAECFRRRRRVLSGAAVEQYRHGVATVQLGQHHDALASFVLATGTWGVWPRGVPRRRQPKLAYASMRIEISGRRGRRGAETSAPAAPLRGHGRRCRRPVPAPARCR